MLKQIDAEVTGDQARLCALFDGHLQILPYGLDQIGWIEPDQRRQLVIVIQGRVARGAVLIGRHGEQARRHRGRLHAGQRAPCIEDFGQAQDRVLTHLVAARATQQQCGGIALLHGQCATIAGERIADRHVLQLMGRGSLVQLVQFQPYAVRHRAIQQAGTHHGAVQTVQGALRSSRQERGAVFGILARNAQHDLLVANRQVVLQRLAQVGDLARAFVEHDRLIEEVPFQMLADEVHLGPEQLEHLQAVVAGCQQLVELTQPLVQQPSGFPQIGLGQLGNPALEIARRRVAEGQAQLRWRRCAQQQMGAWRHRSFPGSTQVVARA